MTLRFDDSLETVLSADMSTPFGAQSAWRQLVDLIGRGRIPPSADAIAKLTSIRSAVAPSVRAASARGVAFADPPVALVRLFADDDLAIAAPVLRMARLRSEEWIGMLPGMSPASRSILRHRRDLSPAVRRALESFGSIDFVLPEPAVEAVAVEPAVPMEPVVPVDDVAGASEIEPEAVDDTSPATIEAIEPDAAIADAPEPEIEPQAEEPAKIEIAEADAGLAEASEPTLEPTEAIVSTETAPGPVVVQADAPDPETLEAPIFLGAESGFVSLASVALGLPVVAEAMRQSESDREEVPATAEAPSAVDVPVSEPEIAAEPIAAAEPEPEPEPDPEMAPVAVSMPEPPPSAEIATLKLPPAEASNGVFQIAELVARIEPYQQQREQMPAPAYVPAEIQPELFDLDPVHAPSFRFETDAAGVVRWIEGAARAPLIGLSLDLAALPSGSRVDGVAAGAFRRRAGFSAARLVVEGNSDAAGQWRITGIPVFDRESGRFTGYRGTARRPRADESAEPVHVRGSDTDGLRQPRP